MKLGFSLNGVVMFTGGFAMEGGRAVARWTRVGGLAGSSAIINSYLESRWVLPRFHGQLS
jgi:hypothetical protein